MAAHTIRCVSNTLCVFAMLVLSTYQLNVVMFHRDPFPQQICQGKIHSHRIYLLDYMYVILVFVVQAGKPEGTFLLLIQRTTVRISDSSTAVMVARRVAHHFGSPRVLLKSPRENREMQPFFQRLFQLWLHLTSDIPRGRTKTAQLWHSSWDSRHSCIHPSVDSPTSPDQTLSLACS